MVKEPEPDREGHARHRGARGRVEAGYFAFGDYDVVFISELPDNVSAAAFALAVTAGGAVSSYKTTVLLSDEAVEAMRKAAESSYRPATAT